MRKDEAVVIEVEGDIDLTPKSAYEIAKADGYLGSEEQYAKELALRQVTQEEFDAIPGRLNKLTTTTDKAAFHHITDSANMKVVDFGMEGITEQETTEGKNYYSGGDVSGTKYVEITDIMPIPSGTYTFSANIVSSDTNDSYNLVIFYNEDGEAQSISILRGNRASKKITFEKTVVRFMCYASTSNANSEGDTFSFTDIQIEPGEVATDYEPFTNGPSPNPDCQQEVKLAGVLNEETGRYEHKCCVGNKNWCKDVLTSTYVQSEGIEPSTTRTFAHNTYRKGFVADGSHNESTVGVKFLSDKVEVNYYYFGYGLGFPMQLPKGQTVTASVVGATTKNFAFYWAFYDNNGKYISGENGKESVSIPSNCEWTVVIVSGNPNDGWVSFNAIQVELDFVETNYTPHASQPFTLTSDRPLTKWDNLVKVDGKWYWDYKQLHLVVDENNLEFYDDTWRGFRVKNSLPEVMPRRDGYCNQLRVDYGNINPEAAQNHMWLGVSNQHLYIIGSSFYDSELDDKGLANFKAHLNEHPLEIYTYKDESELVPLLDEEQTLLHNLETYYGVTNVYNEQGCPMWLTYVQDTKIAVDNKFENIRQALVSLGANV